MTTAEPFLPLRTTLLSFPPRAELAAFLYVLRKKLSDKGRDELVSWRARTRVDAGGRAGNGRDGPDEEEEVRRNEEAAEDGGRLGAVAVADLGKRERHVGRGKVGVACAKGREGRLANKSSGDETGSVRAASFPCPRSMVPCPGSHCRHADPRCRLQPPMTLEGVSSAPPRTVGRAPPYPSTTGQDRRPRSDRTKDDGEGKKRARTVEEKQRACVVDDAQVDDELRDLERRQVLLPLFERVWRASGARREQGWRRQSTSCLQRRAQRAKRTQSFFPPAVAK